MKKGACPQFIYMRQKMVAPRPGGDGTHVAFITETREAVHEFFEAVLRLGGSSAGEPSPRTHYGENYYAAYVRDPAGNKLQAVCSVAND